MEDLTKILKDEAWLEAEKRGTFVPLSDKYVYNKAIKIWEKQYENLVKKKMDNYSI